MAGDVVGCTFGVEDGELAAGLGRASMIFVRISREAGVEGGEEAGGSGADNGEVVDVVLGWGAVAFCAIGHNLAAGAGSVEGRSIQALTRRAGSRSMAR